MVLPYRFLTLSSSSRFVFAVSMRESIGKRICRAVPHSPIQWRGKAPFCCRAGGIDTGQCPWICETGGRFHRKAFFKYTGQIFLRNPNPVVPNAQKDGIGQALSGKIQGGFCGAVLDAVFEHLPQDKCNPFDVRINGQIQVFALNGELCPDQKACAFPDGTVYERLQRIRAQQIIFFYTAAAA